jgi:hypothetical protein
MSITAMKASPRNRGRAVSGYIDSTVDRLAILFFFSTILSVPAANVTLFIFIFLFFFVEVEDVVEVEDALVTHWQDMLNWRRLEGELN